jgi:hypothetical protein
MFSFQHDNTVLLEATDSVMIYFNDTQEDSIHRAVVNSDGHSINQYMDALILAANMNGLENDDTGLKGKSSN